VCSLPGHPTIRWRGPDGLQRVDSGGSIAVPRMAGIGPIWRVGRRNSEVGPHPPAPIRPSKQKAVLNRPERSQPGPQPLDRVVDDRRLRYGRAIAASLIQSIRVGQVCGVPWLCPVSPRRRRRAPGQTKRPRCGFGPASTGCQPSLPVRGSFPDVKCYGGESGRGVPQVREGKRPVKSVGGGERAARNYTRRSPAPSDSCRARICRSPARPSATPTKASSGALHSCELGR
jgi:hypothetical protein